MPIVKRSRKIQKYRKKKKISCNVIAVKLLLSIKKHMNFGTNLGLHK